VQQAAQPGAIDLQDEKIVRAAQALFLERGGSRQALEALRAGETPLGRALFERLAAQTQFAPGAAEALAEARGFTVREALITQGASAGRVELGAPLRADAGDAGVPTSLEIVPLADVHTQKAVEAGVGR
jgi:hypothetical protein